MVENLIAEYFPNGGTFVEIGAYDGDTYSHTAKLADNGWKGYCFEPVIEFAERCRKRHEQNDVQVIPVGIGTEGIRTFYTSELLSTLNGREYQEAVADIEYFRGAQFSERTVYIADPRHVPPCDLLIVDVEGTEYDVLKGLSHRPRMIVVELHEKSKAWEGIVDIQRTLDLLQGYGYRKLFSNDIDSVFIHG